MIDNLGFGSVCHCFDEVIVDSHCVVVGKGQRPLAEGLLNAGLGVVVFGFPKVGEPCVDLFGVVSVCVRNLGGIVGDQIVLEVGKLRAGIGDEVFKRGLFEFGQHSAVVWVVKIIAHGL